MFEEQEVKKALEIIESKISFCNTTIELLQKNTFLSPHIKELGIAEEEHSLQQFKLLKKVIENLKEQADYERD